MPTTTPETVPTTRIAAAAIAFEVPAALTWNERLAAVTELTKPRITRLVTITAAVGFIMAALGRPWTFADLMLSAFGCLAGTALSASGANALNMWWERRRDACMVRTAHRPLPERRITAPAAFFAGMTFSITGVLTLLVLAGPAPALVSLVTILWYVLFYTPLKPVTPLNTLVGAVPGALPPLIGWTATAPVFGYDDFGGLTVLLQPGGWCLFLLMVVWQIPHFLAIAWMYRDDYAAGGYRMMPIVDPSGRATSTTILVWSFALLASTLAPALIMPEHLGFAYPVVAMLSGLVFIGMCVRLAGSRTRPHARAVFFASIIHLPLLLIAMVADAIVTRFIL
jgi:protoheme IX farnesyltransferase